MFTEKALLTFVLILTTIIFQAQSLPDMSLKNTDGESVSLATISKDKTVVLSFWATWCVPCINELDAIADEYEDLQDEMNFELIAVSVDNSRSKSRVKPLVNGKGWEYQVLLDSNQKLKRALNITSVPYVIIVKNGKIEYTHSGYTPGAEEELIEKFKSLQ